jgi:hypothetical protein
VAVPANEKAGRCDERHRPEHLTVNTVARELPPDSELNATSGDTEPHESRGTQLLSFLTTGGIDGAALLCDTRAFLRRFCVFPDEHCLVGVTLWAAHAHMVEHFYTSPRLALLSPEPSSGKTRVLGRL